METDKYFTRMSNILIQFLKNKGLDPMVYDDDDAGSETVAQWYNWRGHYCQITFWHDEKRAMFSSHYQGRTIKVIEFDSPQDWYRGNEKTNYLNEMIGK